jgi:serine/threonine-protein kinase HipA
MTDHEVTTVVESLPTWDLPDDFLVTASLGGIQSKVLLTSLGDGWAWPGRGAVSTHIIKPTPLESTIPDLLASEDWALKTAAAAGIPAAKTHLHTFGAREAIVVDRFDPAPVCSRIHQEDFTQAFALGNGDAHSKNYSPHAPRRR